MARSVRSGNSPGGTSVFIGRKHATAAAVGVCALLLAACGSKGAQGTATGEIVFGMITDTSGGASAYTPYSTVGIEMAVKEINAAGGIGGKQIKLIRESDGSQSTQTPTLARRLIDNGADVLIMNSGSASAIAVKPVCFQSKILCVAPTNLSAAIIDPPQQDYIWILGPTSAGIGEIYATGMAKAGVKRLAVVSDDVPTIQSYVPALVGAIQKGGIQQVANEKVATDSSDVSAQIARVKAANPDAVLIMSLGGQAEVLVQKGLHQQMPAVKRFGLASLGNQPTTWDLADPGSLEGLVVVGSIDKDNARTTDFAKKLAALGGPTSVMTAYQPQGYDSIYLVKEAIEKAGGAGDHQKINDAFSQITKYKPHYGRNDFSLSYSKDKHVGSDGNCGIVLNQFDSSNKPTKIWDVYQGSC
jgi:branched-chain amino acid transport system substrate-binding protein